MRNRQDKLVYICAAAVGLGAFITTLFLKSRDAWMMPRILSALIFLLGVAGCCVDVGKERAAKKKDAAGEKGDEDGELKQNAGFKPGELRLFLIYTLWLVALVLAIYIFGFYISIFVFCASYLAWRRRKLLSIILFSGIFTGAIYVIFEFMVKMYLFKGLIFLL